jgi:hypothetical protein
MKIWTYLIVSEINIYEAIKLLIKVIKTILSTFKISDQFYKIRKIWDQNAIKSIQFNKLNIYFDNFYKFMSICMP